MNIKSILQSIAVSIIVALLGWIGVNTMGYKDMESKFKTHTDDEWTRYVELNTKVYNMQKAAERQQLIDSIRNADKR